MVPAMGILAGLAEGLVDGEFADEGLEPELVWRRN
jgi:hypothetical protein